MKKLFIFLSIAIFIFASCDNDPSKLLPNVSGKAGEVVLVIEPNQWSSEPGEQFRKKLSQQHPALPQKEPVFDLIHIPYNAFTNIFKIHRNIIIAKIDKDVHEPKMVVQQNVWAKPQIIITVLAPNDSSLTAVLKEKGDFMVERILRKEIERYAKNYKKYEEIEIANALERKFGIRLTMPKGYTLDVDTTDFVWIESRGRSDAVQGLLVYSYDKPEVELTTDFIFAKRNQFTKRFVPGAAKNSYMAVESQMIPFRREMKINGINVIELRSLWKIKNDFMGGPFVSFAFIDEEHNKVINIDGFVYAPQFDKRDYLRQLEAILSSVQYPKKNEPTNK
jgi:hypothetical protein